MTELSHPLQTPERGRAALPLEKTPLESYVAPAKPSLIGLSRAELMERLAELGVETSFDFLLDHLRLIEHAPIGRRAGLEDFVLDDRQPFADKPIEQRGFADIRPANERD